MKKTSADYQREYRKRLREQGLVKKEVWVRPEHAALLGKIEKQLRVPALPAELNLEQHVMEASGMAEQLWNTLALKESLEKEELFISGGASLEVIEGVEPSLYFEMKEYGDLPVFLSVVGEQVIVESVLWPLDKVEDAAGFNEAVLRSHKYFPLSTISLDIMPNGESYYHMFGALSARSSVSEICFEIEMLAENVIQATEAYSRFLKGADALVVNS